MSVGGILSGNLNVILYASQGAELSLDNNAVSVSVSTTFLVSSTFSSNGREEQSIMTEEKTAVDAGLAGLEVRTVVQVQSDRNVRALQNSSLYHLNEVGVFA